MRKEGVRGDGGVLLLRKGGEVREDEGEVLRAEGGRSVAEGGHAAPAGAFDFAEDLRGGGA